MVQDGPPSPSPSSSSSWSSLIAKMITGLSLSQSSPKKPAKLECDVCNMSFSGPESQDQHNKSEKHKRKMQAAADSQNATNQSSLTLKESKLECVVCNVPFTGPESQKQHNDSDKHRKKVSQMTNGFVTVTGPESKKQHMDGERHKKNVEQSAQIFNGLNRVDPSLTEHLRCDECSMTFTGPESLSQHLNGGKHRKKLQQKIDEAKLRETSSPKTSIDQVSLYCCKPCNITCTSKVSLAEHEASRNHVKMLSSM